VTVWPRVVVVLCFWGALVFSRPWVVTLACIATALGLLALPKAQRISLPLPFFLVPAFLLALTFPMAFDHQRVVELVPLFPLALAAWSWGASQRFGEGFWRFVATAGAAASLVALAQALGGLQAAGDAVALLPPALREVGAARLATGRAFGTLPIPGHFAALQALLAPLLIAWLKQTQGWRRFLPVGLLVLSLAGCLASRSLLGTGLWVLAVVLTLYRSGPRPLRVLLPAAGLAALALVLFLREDMARFEPLALRAVNWRVAFWVFLQHPWVGVGLGGVGIAGLTSPWGEHNITPFAHNTPLQLLAEFGLLGLPFFLALFFLAFRLAFRLWLADRPTAVALLVALFHNFFDFSFYEPALLFPFCLLAGARSLQPEATSRLFFPLLSLLLGGAAVVAALQARTQGMADQARQQPPEQQLNVLLRAASLSPWRLAEPMEAAWLVVQTGDRQKVQLVEELLDRRAWVAPQSASWAQAKATLLLLQGRKAEAWAWAREALRRAPFRRDLAELEQQCRP